MYLRYTDEFSHETSAQLMRSFIWDTKSNYELALDVCHGGESIDPYTWTNFVEMCSLTTVPESDLNEFITHNFSWADGVQMMETVEDFYQREYISEEVKF